METKRFDFQKGEHKFSFIYDDTKKLINHLVDIADTSDCALDLMDIFSLVRQLAKGEIEVKKKVG